MYCVVDMLAAAYNVDVATPSTDVIGSTTPAQTHTITPCRHGPAAVDPCTSAVREGQGIAAAAAGQC